MLGKATHDRDGEAVLSKAARDRDGEAKLDEVPHDRGGKVMLDEAAHDGGGEATLCETACNRDGKVALGEAACDNNYAGTLHDFLGCGIIQSSGSFKNCCDRPSSWDVTTRFSRDDILNAKSMCDVLIV